MNVSSIQEKMTSSMCSGNESSRGRPIWELAHSHNEQSKLINGAVTVRRRRLVSPDKCERLGVC